MTMHPAKLIAKSAVLAALAWSVPVGAPAGAQEVLPWANQPVAPQATAALPSGDQATLDAAQAQCGTLFEAACRDLKTCSWVGEVALPDGSVSPQRCVARPPAPPKAAKKTPKAPAVKKEAAAAPGAPAAPAVKAAVTRVEDVEGPAEHKKAPAEPKAVKKAAVPVIEPAAEATVEVTPEAAEKPVVVKPAVVEKKPDPAPQPNAEAAAAKEEPKKVETKSPIAAKPSQPAAAKMPSFSAVSPIMPGSESNAVVVTVPSR